MSVAQPAIDVEYPESDGEPMGETDVHIEWTIRIRDMLKRRYKGQRVYVASDLLLYYAEGNPKRFLVPDSFVVKDCDPGPRRTFKTWEEDRVPHVAFEITSAGTRREDTVFKPQRYAQIGIAEYFLYDSTSEYLQPALQGFRLDASGEYAPIAPDKEGTLLCEQLGISLSLSGSQLVIRDLESGQPLQTEGEAEHEAFIRERTAREHERAAREHERAAREAAEAEVAKLRERLEQLGDDLSPRS